MANHPFQLANFGHEIPSKKERVLRTLTLAELPYRRAAPAWLESRKPYLSPRTYEDYESYIRILTAYFGENRAY